VKQRVLTADDDLHEVHAVLQVRVEPPNLFWEDLNEAPYETVSEAYRSIFS